jgi:hypothetical protein
MGRYQGSKALQGNYSLYLLYPSITLEVPLHLLYITKTSTKAPVVLVVAQQQ